MPTSYRREVLTQLGGHFAVPPRWRMRLLRKAGVVFDGWAIVLSGLRIAGEGSIRVGDGCFINHDCLIDCAAEVRIGRNVALGNRVSLITSSHEIGDPALRAGDRSLRPITIGDGAWLGANVTVLGGVTVGAGAVVAAGAVVTRDVPPHTLWAGVPARHVRDLPH